MDKVEVIKYEHNTCPLLRYVIWVKGEKISDYRHVNTRTTGLEPVLAIMT